jgi:zinc/manganese transport system substrate-binding protein
VVAVPRWSVGLVVGMLALAGCGSGGSGGSRPAAGGALRVVATTTQVADFARSIGGDRVEVTGLLKPNIDPHEYEPSPADVAAIRAAQVLVKNGAGLDGWLDALVAASGFRGVIVDASAGITLRRGAEGTDPHIWHDPRNAALMCRDIAAGFAGQDPPGAAAYRRNLLAYQAKLTALDQQIAASIGTVPAPRRLLVTNHDAFGYYVARYGLRFVGSVIPSFDTAADLSGAQLSDLVARIRQTGVRAVFSEASLPPATAQTIAREAGVRVVAGEDALYGDTLGPAGSAGATYLQMEQHNTAVIVAALRG